jgi:hypothetical protein
MKKKIILLSVAVLLLVLLLVVYFVKSNADKKAKQEQLEAENPIAQLDQSGTRLTESTADEISLISLSNGDVNISIKKQKDNWVCGDYPDYDYDQSAMQNIVYCFTGLYAANTVAENIDDLQKYGLDNPVVTASSEDKKGNKQTVYLGNQTPDNTYYYAMVDGDNTVYIIDALAGKALSSTYNDLVDKSVNSIDTSSVTKLDLKREGEDDVLVVFDKEDSTSESYHNTVGLAALTMKKPLENMIVYPYNLESAVLSNALLLKISDLADMSQNDLGKYGLDNPKLSISIEDIDGNSIEVKVGNEATEFNTDDAQYYYAIFDDKPEVFTIDTRAIKPFKEAKIIDFIQNFITLYKRSEVESIEIDSKDKTYNISFKSEGENDFVTDDDGTQRDNRNTYINETLVEREAFSDFYESICALSFDDLDENATTSGEPEVVVSFKMLDGSSDRAEYYNYNDNFYCVKKGDNSSMLINKQAVNKLISDAEKLEKR